MRSLKNTKGQNGAFIIGGLLILFLTGIILMQILPDLQTIIDNAIATGGFDSTTILLLGLIPMFFVGSFLALIWSIFRPSFSQV